MGELVCAAIAPHGFSIIEEISGKELNLFKPTRDAMEKLGKTIMSYRPDTIVVLTPHGLRLTKHASIYLSDRCKGSLSANNETVELDFKCDKELAKTILDAATSEDIPLVGCNFSSMSGISNIEMDWGTLIPLWFCKSDYKPEIVVINPTRDIQLEKLVKLGEVIANVTNNSNKNIALIASADQGHCHDIEGPYGYSEKSKEYDELILSIIKSNDLSKLLDIDMDLVNEGKPDSLWQMLILYGALKITPMKGTLLSYQVPTYFGMAVASYKPDK